MLSGLVSSGTKALGGNRFSLVNLLPATLVTVLVVGLIRSGAYSFSSRPKLSDAIPMGNSAITTSVALAFGIFLIAVVLQPFQVAIVRLLEGYWTERGVAGAVGNLLVQYHLRVKATAEHDASVRGVVPPKTSSLADLADYEVRRHAVIARANRAEARMRSYPDEDHRVLPTALGNILRSGEDAAGIRYGLDAMTVYPRLYPYISGRLDAAMSQQLDVIDSTSAICVAFGIATISGTPLVLRWDGWSLVPLGLLIVTFFAYAATKAAARDHGVLLATIVDLHRFDLLARLHYPLPKNVDDEWEFNQELSQFLSGRTPAQDESYRLLRRYRHEAASAPAAKKATSHEEYSDDGKKEPEDTSTVRSHDECV
jgi:hypothetical protein